MEGIFMNKGLFLIITDAVISFEKIDVLFITLMDHERSLEYYIISPIKLHTNKYFCNMQ